MNKEHKRMKIAFLTSFDPLDRRSWSGTVYHLVKALEEHCGEISYIGPMKVRQKTIGKIINKCSRLLLKKGFEYNASFLIAKKYAKVAAQRLAGRDFDVIITVAGSPEIAFLKTDTPIVLIEDATFAILHNYYPQYTNLLKTSIHQTNMTEQLAISKASMMIYSSEWAARSAVEIYHADERKVHVVPYGANFETSPAKDGVLQKKKSAHCRLLFMGVNWQRKGGEIAFETLLKLEELGIAAELVVCGCTPPKEFAHERMTVIPFLDKNDEKQREEINKLFVRSDFLLLPTRGDCTPIVFCEANAFGLPVITTNTGGVPGIIKDGENGFMLPLSARGAEYAEVIAKIYRDDQRYAELVKSSRAAFDDKLNWDAWGTTVKKLLDELLSAGV
ncbi:MAG TPA: glycosyltransferase family 4 protein [Ktedonobacteraceae bacterium]|nr:glycosyltransferase family 4 protein [Ktedonobacteraceae bacterium]